MSRSEGPTGSGATATSSEPRGQTHVVQDHVDYALPLGSLGDGLPMPRSSSATWRGSSTTVAPRSRAAGMTRSLWLRRDLRVHDHPALEAARRDADALVPVFCFDDRLLHGRHASGPRTQFLLECLADLDDSLRKRGSRLVVRRGTTRGGVAGARG